MKRFKTILLTSLLILLCLTIEQIAFAYQLPRGSDKTSTDENLEILRKISKGVSTVAQKANKALAFVSVSKIAENSPFGMIDPWELFFFGPGHRGKDQGGHGDRERVQKGLGSGFLVDLDKGYILTNNHVIDQATEIQVKLANGETYEGKVLGTDKQTDVAVVQIKNKDFNRKGLDSLALGDSDKVAIGDFVLALGAPFELEASLSFGVVSAVGRGNLELTEYGDFIQTDAAINPGNSGGPLLNMLGQVIGINTAIFSQTGSYNGIGFAIPINLAAVAAEQLINGGEIVRGYLGIAMQPLYPDLVESFNLPKNTTGVVVAKVTPGSPAEKGGLEAGDVIVKANGKNVNSLFQLRNIVGLLKPGSNLDLAIYHGGKKKELAIAIGKMPKELLLAENEALPKGEKPGLSFYGLTVTPITPELKKKYTLESNHGLVITFVRENSPADKAELAAGDVIIEVNHKKINGKKDLEDTMKNGKKALLRIERRKTYFFVPLRIQ